MPRKNNNNNRKMMRRQRKRPQRMRRNRAQMSGAPVSVSSDIQQFTRFSGRGGSLVMHTCAALAELCSDVPADTKGAFADGDSTACAIQLSLTDPAARLSDGTKKDFEFVSPIWDQLASVFVKYTVRSCKLKYMPQAAATNTARMVFAFAEDALHPLVWRAGLKSEELLALSDSMAFMPWKAWEMDVTHKLRKQTFYTYSKATDQVDFVERLSDFGVIGCVTSGVDATPQKCGVLYMESVVEFEEFCPISNDRPVAGSIGAVAAAATLGATFELNETTLSKVADPAGLITSGSAAAVVFEPGQYICWVDNVDNTANISNNGTSTFQPGAIAAGATECGLLIVAPGETFTMVPSSGTVPANVSVIKISDSTVIPTVTAPSAKRGWVTQHVQEDHPRPDSPRPVVKEDDTGKWMRI